MQAKVYNLAGEAVQNIELDDAIFGIKPNMAVMQQAVLRQQANARQGTHSTLTRAGVRGGGRKPWRQKGTGRARQGSTRSPQWTHGGVVFGPHPRSYEQDMPRKMRRLAIRSVFSAKTADGQLMLIDSFEGLEPRTKSMVTLLKALNVGEKSALIFTSGESNLVTAASNLPNVKTLSAHLLSVVDMLKHDYVLLSLESLGTVRNILGTTGGRLSRSIVAEDGAGAVSTSVTSVTAETKSANNVAFAPTGEVNRAAQATVVATPATRTTATTPPAEVEPIVPLSESATISAPAASMQAATLSEDRVVDEVSPEVEANSEAGGSDAAAPESEA